MYIEFDPEVDGAYIWFVDDIDQHKKDYGAEIWPDSLKGEIGLLFRNDGGLLGIEIQPASRYLTQAVLRSAKRTGEDT